ncbi:MAG: phosphate ABC transporter ATP-binding protein [Saprospiraceae bacterium]|nr:phosphate ABC transporter ATP-binding protein [Candidatus Opimibacter skivensis]MBL0008392.1 phosphate ABC transporter ATP-binding protein [Candidatus Opimibacter skivensis]
MVTDMTTHKLDAQNVNVYYDQAHVIRDVSLTIEANTVTAFIGPSGCGKSTFLRLINRMNDYIDGFRKTGTILIDGEDIYDKKVRVEELRKKIGMVFQKPNPFPKSIYENVIYGLRIQGINKKSILDETVERSLRRAAIWDEVKDNLNKSALSLSGGQQQRICIARTLAVEPSIVLMDEPASALDPISTAKIEELIHELKSQYTIIIVTHNMQQAGRVSDKVAFFYIGELIEYSATKEIFINPKKELTQNYITGRFG